VPDIHIVRSHALGLAQARALAARWTEVARQKLQMECHYAQGADEDVVSFRRAGASGHLRVTGERFELTGRLGLLLGMFRSRIEGEIVHNLDQLLGQADPLDAFEQGLARHEARQGAKHDARHAHRHAEPHKPPAAAPVRKPR
jgi:putative polyhydroxyalkanoate system protein